MSLKQKIGITGAEGTIGTILRSALSKKYDLTAFTLHPCNFPSTSADLSSAQQVKGIFDGLDTLIHLAASPSTRNPWEDILKNNIIATQIVFEEAIQAGVKKIIFASSSHTQHGFHMLDKNPIVTDTSITHKSKISEPPIPDSYYGVSKLFGENLGSYLSTIHDIQFIALRIGCATKADDPHAFDGTPSAEHLYALYLSHPDCIQIFQKSIETNAKHLVAYAISDNTKHGIFDLAETKSKLGYQPQSSTDNI